MSGVIKIPIKQEAIMVIKDYPDLVNDLLCAVKHHLLELTKIKEGKHLSILVEFTNQGKDGFDVEIHVDELKEGKLH